MTYPRHSNFSVFDGYLLCSLQPDPHNILELFFGDGGVLYHCDPGLVGEPRPHQTVNPKVGIIVICSSN